MADAQDLELPPKYQGRDDEEELKERYQDMLFEPGEAAGVVGAQSISEPATQMTMETYHSAGAAKVSITLGLPRLIEIIDARKNPKTPIMNVYLEEDYADSEDKAREVAANIQAVKLRDIINQDSLNIGTLELEFVLDEDVLDEFRITREDLKDKLSSKLKNANITIEDNLLTIYPSKEDYDLTDLQSMKKKAMDVRLKGLKGVEQVVLSDEDDEWMIQTAGINLRKVLKLDGVDETRTTCNDLFEIRKIFGVEAARNKILKEMQSTLEEQGISVNVRWLMLMADAMTKDGDIKGATRYGLTGAKHSVLARASFEETKKHLTNAALHGETDPLSSVVENLIVGQVVPVGTGRLELKAEPGKASPVEDATIPMEIEEPEFDEEDEDDEASEIEELETEEIAALNVDEVKELITAGQLTVEEALEIEHANKERVTLIDWLEGRAEDDEVGDFEEEPEDDEE